MTATLLPVPDHPRRSPGGAGSAPAAPAAPPEVGAERSPHSRPRLLPCLLPLRRSESSVLLGTDPARGVLLDHLSPDQVKTVFLLDGGHTLADLYARTGRAAVDSVLEVLSRAGLLEEPAGPGATGRLRVDRAAWALRTGARPESVVAARAGAFVEVHGRGRLATGVAGLLAAAGVGHVHVRTGGVVGYDDVGCGFGEEDVGRSRALAVAAHLRRQAPSVRTGPAGRRRVADVVVLTDWHAPEPEVLGALMADRVTHLPVRVTEGVGVVGPLVRPRRGACLQCVELRRAAGDPHWSRLSAQLLHHVPAPDLPTAHTAAALTAAQVLLALSWHEGHDAPPPSWSTVLTVDPLALTAHREVISAHPDCPCGAASSRPDYM